MPALVREARKSSQKILSFFLGPDSAGTVRNSGQLTGSVFSSNKGNIALGFSKAPSTLTSRSEEPKNKKKNHSDKRRRLIFLAKPRNWKIQLMTQFSDKLSPNTVMTLSKQEKK